MKAHGHHAEKLERSALAVVAGEAAEDIAQEPGEHRAGEEQTDRPGQGTGDQRRDRRGKGGEGRTEIKHQDAAPVGEILIDEAALHSIELPQRLAHPQHGLGASVAESRHRRDHLLDRIDGRQMGDEECQRYADEDDEHELHEPLGDVERIDSHGPNRHLE